MATRLIESSSTSLQSRQPSEVQIIVGGVPFNVGKELVAAKSGKLAPLLEENPPSLDLSYILNKSLADAEMFEHVARFCHGCNIHLSTDNVIHIACLAQHLGMTEDHCRNNLLGQAIEFFRGYVLSCWNRSIRALKSAENIFKDALDQGLVGACFESIISKALCKPSLLGEPVRILHGIKADELNDPDLDHANAPKVNVRRKLFSHDWKCEDDLTILCPRVYEYIVASLTQGNVPLEYVSASIFHYAKRWVLLDLKEGENGIERREIIEQLEKLLPMDQKTLPCSSLFEMLKAAIVLDASEDCKSGFEMRIGKQLEEATSEDLLIPSQGYANLEKYDTECVKRILKIFFNNYNGGDGQELIAVAELVENFLIDISSDIDLKMHTFVTLAGLSSVVSEGIQNSSDGIYRAIDLYFDKHKYLTETEREEICKVLDCNKMSPEACLHAAQNERLPIRVVVQVLFVRQLQLRDTIPKEEKGTNLNDSMLMKYEVEEEDDEDETGTKMSRGSEEEVKAEMEKMGSKVMELERECHMMRREIENGGWKGVKGVKGEKGKGGSVWKEMKRKLGCMTSIHDRNCHIKKKKMHRK